MSTRPVLLQTPAELRKWRNQLPPSRRIGFVPTMGALHEGHADLLRKSAQENEETLLSVFVNPTQFNDPKDFEKYPATLEADLALASSCGVSAVFHPRKDDLYPDHYRYRLTESDLSLRFCGAHRPGHFDGVLSVVMKLLQLAQAQKAYFGEKDFQQLRLVQGMVEAFFIPTEIVPVPTRRESDGLAMSSRNRRLSPAERDLAPRLYEILKTSASAAVAADRLQKMGFRVDYVEDWQGRRLAAAFLGETRLIDNVPL